MVDYPYAGILVADAVTFQRATNAAVTVYDVNDLTSTTPLVLKDLSGLPLPNPLTSSSDGFVQPFVTTSEGVKLIGGGLTVVEYSHKGMRDAAAAAATAAQTAAANAASAVTASLSSAVSNAQSAATAAANAAALVGTPADNAIAAAINGSGTATKAALSATYADRKPATPAVALSQRDFLRASDYGVGNGVGDDGAKLTTAIADARANGYPRVVLPSKQLNFLSAVDFTGVKISGDGSTTILQKNWSSAALFTASGSKSASAVATVTADVFEGGYTLPLSSTAGIAAGDWLLLRATTAFFVSGPYATQYKGEQVRVKTVNSGTQVTLTNGLRDRYKASDGAAVDKLTLAKGSAIEGVNFENTEKGLHNAGFVSFAYCDNPKVSGVGMLYSDAAGLSFDTCLDPIAKGLVLRDFSNDAANSRFGYGIAAIRATQGGLFTDIHARNLRHAFTTAAVDGQYGVPRDITVANSIATECTSAAWDTHPAGDNITFDNLTASATPHIGFQLRARGGVVRNCNVRGASWGYFLEGCHGLELTNSTARKIRKNTTDIGAGGVGLFINSATDHVNISGMLIDGTDSRGMHAAGALTRSRVSRNTILNTGQNDTGKEGIYLTSGSVSNYLDSNHVGNAPAGAFGEENTTGFMIDGISLLAGANNNTIRDTRQIGTITGALVNNAGTGNTVS